MQSRNNQNSRKINGRSLNNHNKIPNSVCVICLGNICRSPAAEYLLRSFVQQSSSERIQKIKFNSAGIWSGSGRMNHLSAEYLRNRGINPVSFRSKGISESFLSKFDLIIVMEDYMIKDVLQYISKDKQKKMIKKIFTLKNLNGENGDITDPYGMNKKQYFRILEGIEELCLRLVKNWEKLS